VRGGGERGGSQGGGGNCVLRADSVRGNG